MNQQRLNLARQMLIEEMDHHAAECTNPNCSERVNVAAWIAHSIGVKTEHSCFFTHLLHGYEASCQQRRHGNGGEG